MIILRLCKKLLNLTTSCIATEHAISLASMVGKAIKPFFLLFHEMTLLLSKNAYPNVDLHSSRSPSQLTFE